jgi:hypothetical protein
VRHDAKAAARRGGHVRVDAHRQLKSNARSSAGPCMAVAARRSEIYTRHPPVPNATKQQQQLAPLKAPWPYSSAGCFWPGPSSLMSSSLNTSTAPGVMCCPRCELPSAQRRS